MWSRFVMSQVKHNSYFLFGVALGLWASLAVIPLDEEAACAGAGPPAALAAGAGAVLDEFEPQREERPLGPAGQAAGRSVQRPRYYSTELGMRGSLLTGVLSSEAGLQTQVAALNQTLARLQPALKFFITASAMSSVPGLANVVGFTDTREMLKPFHALKYLADNYLEEYDFFFLVSDGAFVNARRLTRLASRLSVGQDVYLGTAAEPEGGGQYCSLEGGIILSNSVLRSVHGELDWCVRNSYSPHHHENLGRCVLHAAHLSCQREHQGERYESVLLAEGDGDGVLPEALADAVTARPAPPAALHRLHAFVSRVQLERGRREEKRLRVELVGLAARHPPHYRNASWPPGLRAEPGLAPPRPDTRFDHARWTLFNATHAFMPDELRAAAPLARPHADAVRLVVAHAARWARRRWAWAGAGRVALAEGAWQWDAPRALRYRLVLRLTTPQGAQVLRSVEVCRGLGAARLVPVRYVTESARVVVLLPVVLAGRAPGLAAAALRRHADPNTAVHLVAFRPVGMNSSAAASLLSPLREAADTLLSRHRVPTTITEAAREVELAREDEEGVYAWLGREATAAARPPLARDALVLSAVPRLDYTQDLLNRVRMNTIQGAQWFLPLPFARYARAAPATAGAGAGRAPARAAPHAGRFNRHAHAVVSFYMSDLDAAEEAWRAAGGAARAGRGAGVARVLAAGPLRALVAPEPAGALAPRARPARAPPAPRPRDLDLGDKAALAQLLLEAQHAAAEQARAR